MLPLFDLSRQYRDRLQKWHKYLLVYMSLTWRVRTKSCSSLDLIYRKLNDLTSAPRDSKPRLSNAVTSAVPLAWLSSRKGSCTSAHTLQCFIELWWVHTAMLILLMFSLCITYCWSSGYSNKAEKGDGRRRWTYVCFKSHLIGVRSCDVDHLNLHLCVSALTLN